MSLEEVKRTDWQRMQNPISLSKGHTKAPNIKLLPSTMSSSSQKEDPQSTSPSTSEVKQHVPNPRHIEPFTYINNVPGKDVRGKLIDCFQLWLQIPSSQKQTLSDIKEIVGVLHNASLLIDDIEDNSHLRRGIPVAHHIFGVAPVINCANYMYFVALEKCHALNNAEAMQVFVQEMLNLHRGQGDDIMVCMCFTLSFFALFVGTIFDILVVYRLLIYFCSGETI